MSEDLLGPLNDSQVVYKKLQFYTGMSTKEIDDDLIEKERILEWMLDNKYYSIDTIGLIMSQYYLGILDTKTFAEELKKGANK